MIEAVYSFLSRFRLKDIVDILVISFIIYQALRLIRGTRAWQMTFGVISLFMFYFVARVLDLATVEWLLEEFFPYIIFALIVVFSSELRKALTEIGKRNILRRLSSKEAEAPLEEIVLAATTLSGQRIGALIVIENEVGLKNFKESGIKLDAHLTYDLLLTIFYPKVPLHDGAVIVSGDRIAAAGCFLPLTTDPFLSKELGTRHRAAIGVTEETDAITVVVSEETGTISFVQNGRITRNLDGPRLMKLLAGSISSLPPSDGKPKEKPSPGGSAAEQEVT
jgi:diadenylate cyclase